MRRIGITLAVLMITALFSGAAFAKITVTSNAGGYDVVPLENLVKNAWEDPTKFSNGSGNAALYSSQVANLNGYQNYDLFAVMIGGNVGVQMPSLSLSNVGDELSSGDIYAGGSVSIAGNLGLNLGVLPLPVDLDGWYGNIKFGKFTSPEIGNIKSESSILGLGVSYGILEGGDLFFGFLKWRGISASSGINYITSKTTISDIPFQFSGGALKVDSKMNVVTDSTIVSIPLELNTSGRLFWLINLNVGIGADLNVGSSEIIMSNNSDILLLNGTKVGTMTMTGSTDEGPSFVRPRVMGGFGVCLGPVTIDISAAYYLMSGGSVGASAGIVW